ncbi:hypothetical protein EB796_014037 [Bugula neritina]|uniref:Uncharacterized protein n=1 Tax=Bugula neritina TaxID=10212 RepID=A0A7J7JPU8_BUGNE|nr:hypothetical protein EB796_019840 [Bugula neritina]KAF6027654.1 hypothetical protein EB796_014037 [Bugula neritina]
MIHSATGESGISNDLFTHPDVKAAKLGQKKMEAIAENEALNDSEKVREHSQVLKRYLENFKDAIDVGKKEAILGKSTTLPPHLLLERDEETKVKEPVLTPVKGEEKRPLEATLTADKITKALPSHQRSKARKLLRDISKIKTLKWSDEGKLIYHDKLIRGSDITKLVADSVGSPLQISSKKLAWKQFNKILDQHGIGVRQKGAGLSGYEKFKNQLKHTNWYCHE